MPGKVKIFSSQQLYRLAPSALADKLRRAREYRSAITDELIAAGRGNERAGETEEKARAGDELALRWCSADHAVRQLYCEEKRRLTYHGSTRRTPNT